MDPSKSVSSIYQFKITLRYSGSPIWRRIEVPESYSFFDLHIAIQDIFQWSGDHLHEFEMVKPKGHRERKLLELLMTDDFELDEYIGIPNRSLENDIKILPEKETKIANQFALSDDKRKCIYNYDFGSEWRHTITLEKISAALPNVKYPRCTAGRRQTPPEHGPEPDVGVEVVELPFFKSGAIFRDPEVAWATNNCKRF